MSGKMSSILNPFKPKIVHSLPGRLRLRIPGLVRLPEDNPSDFASWMKILDSIEGLTDLSYNAVSGSALVLYDTALITEDDIIATIQRLISAVMKSRLRFLALRHNERKLLIEKLKVWFQANPPNLRDRKPLEIPDEIWA